MRVCIIGDSLSSLTLAKALVNLNVNVNILYKKKYVKLNKSRTIGISKTNIDFFNKNIANIEKLLWKLKKIEIYSNNLKEEKLLKFENNNNQLFSILKNYELYELLKKDLQKNKLFKKKLFTNKNFSIIYDYDFIINCEYVNNITKKYFNKKTIKKYNSFAYTTIIKHENILNDTAIQIFTNKGPLAFLPISKNETSIVYSVHNLSEKKINIEKLIKENNFKYKINKIEKIDVFELKSLNLRSYYHKNILAFGDLLHKVHPLAGQGFNMTIRDIKTLINIINNKIFLGLPLDSSVSEEFENISKHKNFIFSNGIDLIHEFFNFERKTKNTLLSKSIQKIGNNPSINKMFIKIADTGVLF